VRRAATGRVMTDAQVAAQVCVASVVSGTLDE